MFEKIINGMKEQKRLDEYYRNMEDKKSILYSKWQDMLQVKEEIKIITSETEAETEAEYNRFRNELEDMKHCNKQVFSVPSWLNKICEIKEPKYIYKTDKLVIIVPYRYMGLCAGSSKEDYDTVLAQYQEIEDDISLFEKLHPGIFNKYNKCDPYENWF